MAVKKVNLKEYPKFWADFVDRVNQEIDPSASISKYDIKQWIYNWYCIHVHVMGSGSLGEVYMLGRDYTAFIIRWG